MKPLSQLFSLKKSEDSSFKPHEENEEDVDVEDNRVNCHHGRRPEDVVVDRRIRRPASPIVLTTMRASSSKTSHRHHSRPPLLILLMHLCCSSLLHCLTHSAFHPFCNRMCKRTTILSSVCTRRTCERPVTHISSPVFRMPMDEVVLLETIAGLLFTESTS